MENKKYAVFTMDVETFADTECVSKSQENLQLDVLDGFEEYVNILDRHGIKGTFFTVADLAPKIKKKIKRIIHHGHEVAMHSFKHVPSVDVEVDEFRERIADAKRRLGKMLGVEIHGFRAPFFSLDTARLNVLRELGFHYDSSFLDFSKARHNAQLDFHDYQSVHTGVLQNENFFEFSMANQKIFGMTYPVSGGGYVRLFNWTVIKQVIKWYIRHNDYYVFYLHPFELTKKKIPPFKNMKAYDKYYLHHGINNYAKHIEEIIGILKEEGYNFVTFDQLTDIVAAKG